MGRPRKVSTQAIEDHIDAITEVVEVDRPTKASPRIGTRKRTPINGYRNILSVEGKEPGWHYCWVEGENVPRYENAEYEFVVHDVIVGERKLNAASSIGGKVSIPGGNGMTLYLMRVLEEFYNEDMESLQAEIDERESAMKTELNSKNDGRYGEVELSVKNKASKSLSAR